MKYCQHYLKKKMVTGDDERASIYAWNKIFSRINGEELCDVMLVSALKLNRVLAANKHLGI